MGNFKEDIAKVKAFVFDVDGVFTDGKVTVLPSGEALRSFHTKDGFSVVLAVKRGYPVAVISGGTGEGVMKRFQNLHVRHIYLGCKNKLEALDEFRRMYDLDFSDIMFMGDDIPDLEAMKKVGMPVAPADAAVEIKAVARHVSGYKGGEGCVRDIIEQVLKAQGKWINGKPENDLVSQ